MLCKSRNIHEKSANIPIPLNNTNGLITQKYEQSLNISFFDPFASSPPNNFVSKLQARMSIHNTGKK